MRGFIKHSLDAGVIVQRVEVSHPSLLSVPEEGYIWTEVPSPAAAWTVEIEDGEAVPVPLVPSTERMIREVTTGLLRDIKLKRDNLWQDVATTTFGPVNINAQSRDNIQGILEMFKIAAELGQPISEVEFTMADDQDISFTHQQFRQMALQVGLYVNSAHRRKRDLQAEIEAAETLEDLLAIDINSGWPS